MACHEITTGDNFKDVHVSQILAKLASTSLTKLKPATVTGFARFVVDLGQGVLVTEWLNHHSIEVDPTELAASPHTFEAICKHLPKSAVLLKKNIGEVLYDKSCVERRARPIPDTCAFITAKDIEVLGKDTAKVVKVSIDQT